MEETESQRRKEQVCVVCMYDYHIALALFAIGSCVCVCMYIPLITKIFLYQNDSSSDYSATTERNVVK